MHPKNQQNEHMALKIFYSRFYKMYGVRTNYEWQTLILLQPTERPSKIPCSSTLTKNILKTSTTTLNKKGENGSPCLNPLETLAHPLAQPFTKIEKPIKDMQPLIQCLQLELKSFLSKA